MRTLYNVLGSGRILIAAHERPDPDALGSLVAIDIVLRKGLGYDVVAVASQWDPRTKNGLATPSALEPYLERISGELATPLGEFGVVFLLDCTDWTRTGIQEEPSAPVVRIDHHKGGVFAYDEVVVDDDAVAATAVLIEQVLTPDLLENLDPQDRHDLAVALYWGIYGDTGGFSYNVGKAFRSVSKIWSLLDGVNIEEDIEEIARGTYRALLDQEAMAVLARLAKKRVVLSEDGSFALIAEEAGLPLGLTAKKYIWANLNGMKQTNFIVQKRHDGSWSVEARGGKAREVCVGLLERGLVTSAGGHIRAAGAQGGQDVQEILAAMKELLE